MANAEVLYQAEGTPHHICPHPAFTVGWLWEGYKKNDTQLLSGTFSIVGRSIVIHDTLGLRWVCANIVANSVGTPAPVSSCKDVGGIAACASLKARTSARMHVLARTHARTHARAHEGRMHEDCDARIHEG